MEERVVYGNLTVYRERGAYLRRLEQFVKAKAAYDEAFSTNPQDVRLLIGRSRVCSDAVQPQQAFSDAQLALQLEPENMIAKNMQALAMYTMTDFERSLVMNYRGYRQRRQPPYFSDGINQGMETLQDCIGIHAGDVMIDYLPLIAKIEKAQAYARDNPKPLRVSRIPQPETKKKLTQMQARRLLILSRVLAMKYLGPMAYDKFFLQELIKDPRLMSANARGSREMLELVKEALISLSERQEMLRAQRPYYSIKLAEKAESAYQTKFKAMVLEREREANARTADSMLEQVKKALSDKHIDKLISVSERMQMFLDKKIPRTLPDKDIYMTKLYNCIGEGYLCQYRLSTSLSERGNRRRIAFLMGLPIGRPRSFDSVRATYPFKFVEVQETTRKFVATLDMCENATQRCWLYYELARLSFTQKNFPLGKFYAKRCIREAEDTNNVVWWMNGCFALMSGDMQRGNTNEVRVNVEEALKKSEQLRRFEEVIPFLEKCAEMAADMRPADENAAIREREKEILSVMTEEQRVETQVLMKRMATLPSGRRFIVLPQRPGPWRRESERRKYKQRGLTVVPGPDKALRRPPRAEIPGFQIFDI